MHARAYLDAVNTTLFREAYRIWEVLETTHDPYKQILLDNDLGNRNYQWFPRSMEVRNQEHLQPVYT